MALPSNALTTVATVCAELDIAVPADTSALERWIGAASGAVERYCGRDFGKASVTEKVAGYGAEVLSLRRTPVVSVSSVSHDGDVLDATEWEAPEGVDAEAGLLRHATGRWRWTALAEVSASHDPVPGSERKRYSVAYVGGYVLPKDATEEDPRTLPYEVEQAAVLTVVALYRKAGRDTSVLSQSVLGDSITYAGSPLNTAIGRGLGGIIPDEALPLLAPYRRTP